MEEDFLRIGLFLVLAGFALIAASAMKGGDAKADFAVIGFIGPIPIGFGTGKNAIYMGFAMALLILLAYFFITR